MRRTSATVLVLLLAPGCGGPATPATDAAANDGAGSPPYADISFQTRCLHLDGTPIAGCAMPVSRDLYGFTGDMGLAFTCSILEHAGQRDVSVSASGQAPDGTGIGVTVAATVPATGGAVSGPCQVSWTDGITYGGACSASAPTAATPCQISSIDFTTDTATGLPLMDVNILCIDAPSIPAATPAIVRSVSRPGAMPGDETHPFTVHVYSCPTT